jgi:hypothetical protein
MTTTPLMPIAGHTNVTHINDARKLAADVESLGGTMPAALRNLLDAYATLTAPAPTGDPFAAVLDAAVAGKLTSAKLGELVKASAQTRAAEQLRSKLSGRRAASALMQRFSRELLNGAVVAQQGSHALHGFKPIDDGRPEIVAARVVEQVTERHLVDQGVQLPQASVAVSMTSSGSIISCTRVEDRALEDGPRSRHADRVGHPAGQVVVQHADHGDRGGHAGGDDLGKGLPVAIRIAVDGGQAQSGGQLLVIEGPRCRANRRSCLNL